MPIIKTIRNKTPQIPEDCFIAENATIVGEVTLGKQCSIWFNAVLRVMPLIKSHLLQLVIMYLLVITQLCMVVTYTIMY